MHAKIMVRPQIAWSDALRACIPKCMQIVRDAFVISLWALAHFEHVYQEQVGRAVKDTVKLEPICSHCHRFRSESAIFRAQNVWKFTPLCQVSPMWKWVTTWWMALDALKCSSTYSKSISFTVTSGQTISGEASFRAERGCTNVPCARLANPNLNQGSKDHFSGP